MARIMKIVYKDAVVVEDQITKRSSNNQANEEPRVVSHRDQHQHVTDSYLDEMKLGLNQVKGNATPASCPRT